jgi:hypothetical protein
MNDLSKFFNSLGSSDLASLIKCLDAYLDIYGINRPDIDDVWLNLNSGALTLLLENGIIISSSFNQDCIYLRCDLDDEKEFDTYEEALNYTENE